MQFRPCIDIHNGRVKQIVGSSLKDLGDTAFENFVSEQDGAFYAKLYQEAGLKGGHIILLNPKQSEYYEATKKQALLALHAYPGGLQIGGGIDADNAAYFIKEGASHVIVTSYVFRDGKIAYDNLSRLADAVGKAHIVLDLSCRLRGDGYYIVTDRWQKFTEEKVTEELLDRLSESCDEFLVHAVDVEGKADGIEEPLVAMLGTWAKIPVTYAGGVRSLDDLKKIKELGHGALNVTIGSALDLFGGELPYREVLTYINQ